MSGTGAARPLSFGLIGCGAIGARRARALLALAPDRAVRLARCADLKVERARHLAAEHPGCVACADWREVVADAAVDAVLIATTHDALAGIARAAILAGRHVLLEKPGARRAAEIADLPALAASRGVRVRVGFNHRYHRALRRARELVDAGAVGALMFVRARYGHGGRVGYEREWRADPERSGGGELIDQGVHLIDLARWFLGELVSVAGAVHTYFWDMPVEDNAFLLLQSAAGQTAFLHASCTEWKNTFSFELYGRSGKLEVSGLGGSYGPERLTWYRMTPAMGPPETTSWEYPLADDSWTAELGAFIEDIGRSREPSPGLDDAIAALGIVERIYAGGAP